MWQVLQIFIPLCRVQSSNDHSSNSVPKMKTGTQSVNVGGPFRRVFQTFQTWCYLIWSILGCTSQQSILYFVTLHLYQIPRLMHWKFSQLFAMRQNPLTPSSPRLWVKPKFLNSEYHLMLSVWTVTQQPIGLCTIWIK